MKSGWSDFLTKNKAKIILVIIASIFDATSTVLANSKPKTKELNPLGELLLQVEPTLLTILSLSLPPIIVSILIWWTWVRATNKKYSETILESIATLQITAGINNTLIYIEKPTPIPLLIIAALIVHYIKRLHQTWKKEKETKTITQKLPTNQLN